MTTVTPRVAFEVRTYRDGDQAGVLALLGRVLGEGPAGERPPEFFRWKHLDNPSGRSFMTVAVAGDRVIGLRAFMRWTFRAGSATVRAVRAVDTATDPDHQRRGVFSRLTALALEALPAEADLVFNTPNDRSLPGYLKLGWQTVGTVPVGVRVRRPLAVARDLRSVGGMAGSPPRPRPTVSAPPASEALVDVARLDRLLAAASPPDGRLRTDRTVEFLRWRYGQAPLLDYRAVAEERDGELAGLAVFRVRPRGRLWETTLAELLVADHDRRVARRLLRRVVAAARVDHLTCSFPPGSAAASAARYLGFVRAPRGIVLVTRPLRSGVGPDPGSVGSWALSLGDLELF